MNRFATSAGRLAALLFLLAAPAATRAAEPDSTALPLLLRPVPADTLAAPDRLTLAEAIARALEKNVEVQVARGEEQIARNGVHIGNAGLLPKLTASSTLSWSDPGKGGAQPPAESTTTTAQLQATYTLFDGFGNFYTFSRLKNSGALGTLKARRKIEESLMAVARAYYEAANSLEQLRAAEKGVEISDERLRRARIRAEYGQANTRELLAAEVDANNDKVASLKAQLQEQQAMRSLSVLLREPVGSRWALEDSLDSSPAAPLDSLRLWAFQANADLLIRQREVRDARLALMQSRSDHYPEIGLQAAYGLTSYQSGREVALDDSSPGLSGGVTLAWPLFNGRQSAIKSENARIAWLNSRLQGEQAALELERQLVDARQAWENSNRVLAFEEQNSKAAGLNFQRTRELYVLGQADATTFREAQLNLINARKSMASARYDLRIRELELRRLSGRLLMTWEGEGKR